jgi:DNA-binding transcriptional ArsR family regulator
VLRTIFGLKNRPHQNRASGPPAQEAVIEKPQYGLTWFRIRFGMLQVKAYTKGEHVLRMEATVHNARELRCRRGLDNFSEIITRLAGIAERFATTLDCADISFLPDGILDDLPLPSRIGTARTGGVDLNKPRIRAALAAALALTPAPHGFTVADFAARVCQLTRQDGYTIRQAAYDLRKLRGKKLIDKPGRTRRYHTPPQAARTIAALLALRDQVIAPILAGVRSPRRGRKPATWTPIDRDYETLRIGMQALFHDLGITSEAAAA